MFCINIKILLSDALKICFANGGTDNGGTLETYRMRTRHPIGFLHSAHRAGVNIIASAPFPG